MGDGGGAELTGLPLELREQRVRRLCVVEQHSEGNGKPFCLSSLTGIISVRGRFEKPDVFDEVRLELGGRLIYFVRHHSLGVAT